MSPDRSALGVSALAALSISNPPPRTHDAVRDTLARRRGQRMALLLNRGNRGDGVIHLGARQLLTAIGLRWQEIHESDAPPTVDADVLLVCGAGAFCRTTHSMVELVQRYAAQVREVIILPTSFDVQSAPVLRFVRQWGDNYTVFCRERRSLAALREVGARPRRLLLSHDLAFCADLSAWRARTGHGTVGIFRRDREAVYERRPTGLPGRDISLGSDAEPEALLDYVARHAVVHTDRTHAAITAAMLGREVWFYRNAYFKNEAIHEHSLADLPHVRFVGQQPFSLRQCLRALYSVYVQRNAFRLKRAWRAGVRPRD